MFRTRLQSGIVLVAAALGVLLKGGALLAVVLFLVSVIAYQELTAACKVRGEEMTPSAPVIVGGVMTVVYYGAVCLASARDLSAVFPAMVIAIVAAFLAFLFVYVFTFPKYHANQIMSAMFSFLYGPVMLSFLYLLREGRDDALVSMVGDLAASAVKRDHEIKDYGKLIPGHGGILDRFDSVIFTAPMIYFLTANFIVL